jgi:hypothetical protein
MSGEDANAESNVARAAHAGPGREAIRMVRLPDAAGQQLGQFRKAGNVLNIRAVQSISIKVLRGFFAGVGQLLLAADRFREAGTERERYGQPERFDPPTGLDGESPAYDGWRADGDARRAARARTGRHRRTARPTRFRSLEATGNVRILTPDMPAETRGAPRLKAASPPRRKTAVRPRSTTTRRREPRTQAPADLPMPGYDGLSLPSIRARLRGLDVAQLRVLRDHEKSGANRAGVVTMFERRIARLEAAAGDAT